MYKVEILNITADILHGSLPITAPDEMRIYFVDQLTINKSITETASFSFTIKKFNGRVLPNNRVKIYGYDGNFLMEGFITDYSPDPKSAGITFNCVGMLYELTRYSAVPNVVFNNRQTLGAAAYLLRWMMSNSQTFTTPVPNDLTGPVTEYDPFVVHYPGQPQGGSIITWDIGDLSTLTDPIEVATIDLSSEERKLAQLKTLIDSEISWYYEYGGYDEANNKHLVNIGTLQRDSGIILYDFDLSVSINVELPIRGVVGFGGNFTGESGEVKKINLKHAANKILLKPKKRKRNPYTGGVYEIFNPTGFDPEQPGFIYETNADPRADIIPVGQFVTRYYDEFAPPVKDNPIGHERNKAGFQMYKKACSEMLKSNYSQLTWNVQVDDFDDYIIPGMKVRLTRNFELTELDPLTASVFSERNPVISFDEDLWVQSMALTYTESGRVEASLVMLEKPEYDTRNFDAKVIRLTIKKPKSEMTDDYTFQPETPIFGYYEHTFPVGTAAGVSGGAEHTFVKRPGLPFPGDPEDVFGDIEVFPTFGDTPVGSREYVDAYGGTVTYVNPPDFSNSFKISVKINGTWTLTDTATVKIFLEFAP